MGRSGAWRRTLVLLAGVLEIPLVAGVVRTLTRAPVVESLTLAGVPVEISRPPGTGPWPGFVFVTGAHPERRREPVVQRVAQGLARAGFVVAVPDLPGLGEGEVTRGTFTAAGRLTEAFADRPDVRGGRVALAGASTGAGIALVTAADPMLADRVSVVCSIVPFADVRAIVSLATTDSYAPAGGAQHPAAGLLRRTVGRSLAAALPAGIDRDELLRHLRAIGDDEPDPLAGIGAVSVASEEGRSVVALLANRDPARFEELYAALPAELRAELGSLSPIAIADRVRAPVETIVPPADPYFPIDEAVVLAERHVRGQLTVTSVLDHTRPSLSLRRVPDLCRFLGWTSRCLGAAAS